MYRGIFFCQKYEILSDVGVFKVKLCIMHIKYQSHYVVEVENAFFGSFFRVICLLYLKNSKLPITNVQLYVRTFFHG